jgi:hypothetical protein
MTYYGSLGTSETASVSRGFVQKCPTRLCTIPDRKLLNHPQENSSIWEKYLEEQTAAKE